MTNILIIHGALYEKHPEENSKKTIETHTKLQSVL
jgi:hypothetical protein